MSDAYFLERETEVINRKLAVLNVENGGQQQNDKSDILLQVFYHGR